MKYKGFTLIELMIVVAIIGILAAITIPACSNLLWMAKNRERQKKGLPPLPMPNIIAESRIPDQKCEGDVVAALNRDGVIIKVFKNGCEERSY